MQHLTILLLSLLIFIASIGASKILVFSPTLSKSHMISNARVADSLASDGHNVTLLEVEFQVPLGQLNASKLARTLHVPGTFVQYSVDGEDMQKQIVKMSFMGPSAYGVFKMMEGFQKSMNDACEKFVLDEKELLARLKAEHFDIIIAEQLNFCGAALAPLLAIPTHILLSSCPLQEHVTSLIGLANPSSFVPAIIDGDLPDKMSMAQRFDNILLQLAGYSFLHYGADPLTQIFRKHFGPDFPGLRDVVKDSPLVLVNVDELVDFPRPIFSNIVYIGGLGIDGGKGAAGKGNQGLMEPFKSEMTKGQKGVVYFSLGSIVRSTDLDEAFREHIFQACAQLPDYHFIVKIEKEDNFSAKLAAKLGNVFTTQWAPQAEMLTHPRIKLFITHGGYNSLMEAARAGVPLISMGFFADQYRNARVAERNGWGLSFDKRLLLKSSQEFIEAIQKVLGQTKFAENAKRTRKLVLNKPFSAEERLQKSIRFLELSGGKLPELLSESRNMGIMALYNLDIALLAALLLLSLLTTTFLLAKFVWRKFDKNALRFTTIWDALSNIGIVNVEEKGKKE